MYSIFLHLLAYLAISIIPATLIAILITRSMVKHVNPSFSYSLKETFNLASLDLLLAITGVTAYILSIIDVKLIQDLSKSSSDALIIINLVAISAVTLAAIRLTSTLKK